MALSGHGDTALVGAYGNDVGSGAIGSVYAFARTGTTWSQQQMLTASDGARLVGSGFGTNVALSGDTALVGDAEWWDPVAPPGAAYVFTRTGTAWTQQQRLTASDWAAGERTTSNTPDFGTPEARQAGQ